MVEFTEREDRVSLELSEEIIQSMEPGAVFRDYVILSPSLVEAFGSFSFNKGGCYYKGQSFCYPQNCRISSIDFHKTSTCMVTASDDDSIRLYDVASAT